MQHIVLLTPMHIGGPHWPDRLVANTSSIRTGCGWHALISRVGGGIRQMAFSFSTCSRMWFFPSDT
jgi:hypothetical protein